MGGRVHDQRQVFRSAVAERADQEVRKAGAAEARYENGGAVRDIGERLGSICNTLVDGHRGLKPSGSDPVYSAAVKLDVNAWRSFRPDAGKLDDLAPLLGFLGNQLAELVGGLGNQHATEIVKPRLDPGLAVTTANRLDAVPNLPAIAEFIKGYEATAWYGLGAPRDTPRPIVERLNREINAVLAEPRIKARFDDLGCVLIAGSPDEFGKLIAEETEKWGKVVKFSGARVD